MGGPVPFGAGGTVYARAAEAAVDGGLSQNGKMEMARWRPKVVMLPSVALGASR